MGANTKFRLIADFRRHGCDIEVTCRNGHCAHQGVVDGGDCATWFRVQRYNSALESALGGKSAYDYFRCTKCGAKAGSLKPTEAKITVTGFFPVNDAGWKKLVKRFEGLTILPYLYLLP